MPNFNKIVGKNLKYFRRKNNIGLVELSKRCNISKSAISDIENLKHVHRIDYHVPALARALGVDPDLLTESNEYINGKFTVLQAAIEDKNFSEGTIALAEELILLTANRGATEKYKALKLRADIEYRLGNYSVARTLYSQNIQIATLTEDFDDLHHSRYSVASTFLMENMYDNVESIIREDTKQLNYHSRYLADNLHLLSIGYKRRMMYDRAESCLTEAIELISGSTSDSDRGFLGQCLQVLGDLYRELRMFEKSIEISEKAAEICESVMDFTTALYAIRSMAFLYLDDRNFPKCLKVMDSLDSRIDKLKVHPKELTINECLVHICSENYDKLVFALDELRGYRMSPRQLAQLNENAANLAFKRGEFEEARVFFEKAISLLKGDGK